MFTTLVPPYWLARAKKRSLLILCLLVLYSFSGSAQTPGKAPTASISGRVTIDGEGVGGITVTAATSGSPLDNRTVAKTTTDDDGKYQLNGLAAGQFTITPLAKAFVVSTSGAYKQAGQSITVAEGETITKIDFALVRGGVITGRITDTDGRPVIGERVNVVGGVVSDSSYPMPVFDGPRNRTDDRGIYRIYGLSPGTYKVSIGQATGAGNVAIMGMGGSQYTKTFYPGVAEEAKAQVLEVSEGKEISNIDIVARKSGRGATVFGRVVDADSGQPVPNVYVVHASLSEGTQQLGSMNFSGSQTDANGKFRIENVQPGRYAAYTLSIGDGTNTSYSDQTPFDVSDGDVSGVEIKVHRGATISGVAVVENNFDATVSSLLQTVSLIAFSNTKGGAPSFSRSQVGSDGRFNFAGLAPGKVQINVVGFPTPPKNLTLVRTEVDGIEQREGIEVSAGSKITGVRLVFAYGAGSIRGEVKAEGGTLPSGLNLQVIIRSTTGGVRPFNGAVDARGHFVVENVPPGAYEMSVMTLGPDRTTATYEPSPRTVNVESGPVQVVLVVNFAAKKATPE
ncbi:MAG TPA: carboxypeptidase regulatory-like domain-containing protein [Pyrinomonadaceae bacterium]|jgi:protocatechuate 3,4-dioxygenase beta subunit|nr:carboxypeptidase regulatory-like domain-containing protein [Pyrinomonadaceae bacterium]